VKALGSKAGKSVKVVGFDGTPDGLMAVQSGTLAATVAQQPKELGKMAVQNAIRVAKGQKVDQLVKVPVKVVAAK
ncbi:substrate-binding domain-containing protein, partial [Streptomyces sp. 2MCAF27]